MKWVLAYFESGGMSKVTAAVVGFIAAIAAGGKRLFRRNKRTEDTE